MSGKRGISRTVRQESATTSQHEGIETAVAGRACRGVFERDYSTDADCMRACEA